MSILDLSCLIMFIQTSFFRTVTCLDFLESGDVIGGDDSGAVRTYSVSIEGEYYMSHEFEAHAKGVNAILALGKLSKVGSF